MSQRKAKQIKRKTLRSYEPDDIVDYLRALAKRLRKTTLDKYDLEDDGEIHMSTIIRKCGGFSNALISADLKPGRAYKRNRERMIRELAELMIELGHESKKVEMNKKLKLGAHQYEQAFGGLEQAFDLAQALAEGTKGDTILRCATVGTNLSKTRKRRKYGATIQFHGLRYAPMNEQGVVFLFGMLAAELGFEVESVQTGYPDCDAKKRLKDGTFEHVAIEFEFQSRNFKRDGHEPSGCDVIVCWEHDWPECPPDIEVIELRGIIEELGNSPDGG